VLFGGDMGLICGNTQLFCRNTSVKFDVAPCPMYSQTQRFIRGDKGPFYGNVGEMYCSSRALWRKYQCKTQCCPLPCVLERQARILHPLLLLRVYTNMCIYINVCNNMHALYWIYSLYSAKIMDCTLFSWLWYM